MKNQKINDCHQARFGFATDGKEINKQEFISEVAAKLSQLMRSAIGFLIVTSGAVASESISIAQKIARRYRSRETDQSLRAIFSHLRLASGAFIIGPTNN